VPLKFSSGNISQTIYLCLAMGYVMLFATVASRQPGAIHRLLIIAAITNLVVSIASIVSHELIAPFQTADYRVFEDAQISRLIRLTGTFPEASMYAEFTAPIGAYLVGHYFASGRALSLGLGLATLALAILSLSSTGIIAVSALAGFSLLYAIWRKSGASRIFVISFISVSAAAALVIVIPGTLNEVINTLIFEKLTSQSGLERSEWAERGFQVFIDTYFLGAGTGSVRSNGLLFVLLANLGLIGTLLVGALLWRALRRPSENAMLLGAAFALVTLLAAKMASQTTVAPGLLFAMLAGARLPVQRKIARGETRSPRNTGNGPVANGA
ncbi:MAG: hypothetical protein KUG65_01865, partial [Sphingomonadaceae bacterium]|nr:hypothetical protein [Sphingomonadaceae bacterium]